MLVNNIASVVLSRVPHFVVGRFYGAQALGAYTVGAEIAQLAQTELIAPINRALFPGFARLIGDPPAFRRIAVEATAAVFGVVLPVTVGIAIMAGSVVRVLLGSQWDEAVPVIQILVFAGAAGAIVANNIAAYLALGRPYLVTGVLLSKLLVFGIMLLTLARGHGVLGIACAELVGGVASVIVSVPLLIVTLGLRWGEYLLSLWRPLVASCLMGLVLSTVGSQLHLDGSLSSALMDLAVRVPIGAVVYLVAIAGLWMASGRPHGVESLIAERTSLALAAAFNRRKPT
jgi:PST family polysaccharide transporter